MSDLEQFKFYHYDPSYAANICFVILFAIPTIGHTYLMIRQKTWYFLPFVIGCLFETVGYVGRVLGAQQTPDWTLTPYIMQSLLILLAPALFAASIYMILGRLIRLLEAEHLSVVRVKWLTKIFVAGDVMSFLAQSAGGGMLAKAKTKESQEMGNNTVLGGLAIQIIFFGLFIVTTVIFHHRIRKQPTSRSYSVTAPWRQFIMALYFTSILILVRSLFRMIEYGMGRNNVLTQNEAYLFVFDGALMFLVTVTFLWYHPSRILAGYKAVGRQDVESRSDNIPMMGHGGQATKNLDSDGSGVPQVQAQPRRGQEHGYNPYGRY
ncbi:hypothetical protein OQA88_2539 [Cercophora sp. LCS_1]